MSATGYTAADNCRAPESAIGIRWLDACRAVPDLHTPADVTSCCLRGNGTRTVRCLLGSLELAARRCRGTAWYYGLVDAKRQIVKAMAVIRRPRDGALLVSEHASPLGGPFHRPLGGHVEFGEYALDAVLLTA